MKKFFAAALYLLAILFLAAVLTGSFNGLSSLVFSLLALGLVYTLALWSVIDNSRGHKTV